MTLFLLFSIPLTYMLINYFFNNRNIKIWAIILPFVFGLFFSIPFLLIYWSFFHTWFNDWTSSGLYVYFLFNKEGILGIYSVILLALFYFFKIKKGNGSILRELTALVAGLYFSIAIYDFLVAETWYGGLELFIMPIIRIVSILAVSLFLSRAVKSIDWQKYFWLGLALLLPIVMVFIPIMYAVNLKMFSIVITVLLLCCTSISYYLEIKGRLIEF